MMSLADKRVHRFIPGDAVRWYGCRGTFMVDSQVYDRFGCSHINLVGNRAGESFRFPVAVSSVVEINGVGCPLESLPLSPPASDYPHKATTIAVPESQAIEFAALLAYVRRCSCYHVVIA